VDVEDLLAPAGVGEQIVLMAGGGDELHAQGQAAVGPGRKGESGIAAQGPWDLERRQRALAAGYTAETSPVDAPWGERYFHIRDPSGHELSFAHPLTQR
jgi:catechol 2,3-dioxygenase-like lactoylglutathione lyase family enzyme